MAWAFLTNHGLVLSYIAKHPRSTARELALAVDLTERTIHKIIADLVESGYIDRRREGRRNFYRVNPNLPLRHPSHEEAVVGDLLQLLGWRWRGHRKLTRPPFKA